MATAEVRKWASTRMKYVGRAGVYFVRGGSCVTCSVYSIVDESAHSFAMDAKSGRLMGFDLTLPPEILRFAQDDNAG
jgi:hypothetical protein